MARDDESAEGTEVQPTDETVTEAPSEQVTENPESTEAKPAEETKAEEAKPEGPTAEEIKAAVEAFVAKAKEIVEARDNVTGELTAEQISQVKLAYSELPATSAKTKARSALEEGMRDALAKDLDAAKARAYMILGQEVKSAGSRDQIAKPPVDPTEALVNRVTSMYLSSSLVDVPEGVDASWVSKVQELGQSLQGDVAKYKAHLAAHDAWLVEHDKWAALDEATRGDEPKEPEEPEVHQVVIDAAKIARGRGIGTSRARKASAGASTASRPSGPGYSGPRRNVKAHIASAFESEPVGKFLKISEIAAHTSAEYGDDHPSSGAVTASLESAKFDVAGVQLATEGGVKGARKVA